MLSIPAIATILIRYDVKQNSLDWKGFLLLCTPVLAFSFASYSIYKFVGHSFFPAFPNVAAGTWIEGAGLGMLIGVIVGSYFIFIQVLVGMLNGSSPTSSTGDNTVIIWSTGITLLTWLSCIELGKFGHLNLQNKPYTIPGLLIGILLAYLLSRSGRRVSQAWIFLLPLGGGFVQNGISFPAVCQVSVSAKIHANGAHWYDAYITYDKNFDPTVYDLRIHITPGSTGVLMDITHKGHTTTVKGTLTSDSLIDFQNGQPCPQKITENEFTADLSGSKLNSGNLAFQQGKYTCCWILQRQAPSPHPESPLMPSAASKSMPTIDHIAPRVGCTVLAFWNKDMHYTVEPGAFEIMVVGPSSAETQGVSLTVRPK